MAGKKGFELDVLGTPQSADIFIVFKNADGNAYRLPYSFFATTFLLLAGGTLSGDVIGTDFVKTRNIAITRTNGYISSIAKTGGRTLTISRNGDNYVSTINDGDRTFTIARDDDNYISSISVTEN